MAKVLVPLAPGFEELEAVTIIDLLRRAGFDVVTAGLDDQPVTASRQCVIVPDTDIRQIMHETFDLIVLPGGLAGADNLRDDPNVQALLKRQAERNGRIGAICAAPRALARAGVIEGRTITCYPGALDQIDTSAFYISGGVVETDGNIITSRGPGTAMDFALELIEQLGGRELRDRVETPLARP